MVTSYNAGMDTAESHSALYEEAIRTLANRLEILMSTAHVVGVNEIHGNHLDAVKQILPQTIFCQPLGFRDAVFGHPIPHPRK